MFFPFSTPPKSSSLLYPISCMYPLFFCHSLSKKKPPNLKKKLKTKQNKTKVLHKNTRLEKKTSQIPISLTGKKSPNEKNKIFFVGRVKADSPHDLTTFKKDLL